MDQYLIEITARTIHIAALLSLCDICLVRFTEEFHLNVVIDARYTDAWGDVMRDNNGNGEKRKEEGILTSISMSISTGMP